MDGVVARRAWQRLEPLHAVTYFAPETRAATDALGLRGGWMSYFGCRAAPLGPVPAAVVTATFHGFHPAMVARAIPDAWRAADPARLLEARLAAVDAAYRRLLGDEAVAALQVREAAELAGRAAAAAVTAGRPLAAANAALPAPAEPHLALWQALTVLREHRGDGHVAALVGAGIEPCPSQVLADRGWLTAAGGLTDAGRAARRDVEERTDRLALGPYEALGADRCDRLLDLLHGLAGRVVEAGGVPSPNPIGVPWPPTDEVR